MAGACWLCVCVEWLDAAGVVRFVMPHQVGFTGAAQARKLCFPGALRVHHTLRAACGQHAPLAVVAAAKQLFGTGGEGAAGCRSGRAAGCGC